MNRKTIEDEKDKKKLQAIGREFGEDGHPVKLTVPKEDLRSELLEIFDKHYVDVEDEEEATELGDEEEEEQTEEAVEDEEAPKEDEEPTEEPEQEKVEEAEKVEAEPEVKAVKKSNKTMYIARKGLYNIWVGSDKLITFFPYVPQELPTFRGLNKADKELAHERLQNAIKMKRIIPIEE